MQLPLDKRRIGLMAASHFTNDLYVNSVAAMLPFLIPAFGLSLPAASLLVAVNQITSSVVQPLFGHVADRSGSRVFSFAGTATAAIAISSMGIAPEYGFLVLVGAISGLGTASYHPQAAAMVNSLSGGRRGLIMSTYITAGNVGYALSPIVIVAIVQRFGLHGTPMLAIPGLLSAFFLALYAPRNWHRKPAGDVSRPSLRQVTASKWSELTRLVSMATFRTIATITLVAFFPLLLQSRGYPAQVWAPLMTVFLFSGSLGGLLGGYISDFVGRRWVMAVSLIAAGPLILGMLRMEGAWIWVLTILAGAALMGAFSVMTIQAQQTLPDNVGMASGLMLGFSVGIGGLTMGPLGLVAESIGIPRTLDQVALLPLVAGLVAITLTEQPKPAKLVSAAGSGEGGA